MTLPVSVVVPHKLSRKEFFERYCLPSIRANDPAEILVESNDGSAGTGAPFRNAGARKARAPFLFFADDDVILAGDCLIKLLSALVFFQAPNVRYAYSDYAGIVMPEGKRISEHPVFVQRCEPFVPSTVRRGSVCSSMILIEREAFPGFDETLRQLDDWDLTLTLLKRGVHGVRVPEVLFHAYFLDDGVTHKGTIVSVVHAVQRKHGIMPGS